MRSFRQMGWGLVLSGLLAGNADAVTRYVNVSNATPTAPYTNWGSASTNIQTAIDASASGDEILVAPGTYRIAARLQIPSSKTLALRSTQSRAAVVDAQRLCEGLIVLGSNSVVEGFTFRNGMSASHGGGVYLGRISTLRDCLVTSNQAWGAGGVLMQANGAVVENCTIVSNLATYWGGGVVIYSTTTGLVNNCVIADNVASNYGGGVALQGAGTVSNCWIADNRAELETGGGAYLEQGGTLVNSVVVGNQSQSRGAGVYSTAAGVVANCTIVSNASATQFGGGLYLENYATSRNCIVYYNAAPADANLGAALEASVDSCCAVPAVGTSAIAYEPEFVNRALRDFHLLPGSPCIDAGTADQAPGDDYDANLRPLAGRAGGAANFDVGAYEYVRLDRASDFDGDGIADLVVYHPATGNWHGLLSADGGGILPFGWAAAIPVPADFDGDGRQDLAVYHPATGNWHVRSSDTELTQVTPFGWSATVPLPGDYDGDGKADLAVFHQAQGRWHFNCTTAGRYNVQWGWSTTIPVPADYDGDGKIDIAVYHPPSGLWQILISSTGGAIQMSWGWSAALPVPADYDGDGKADVAVFHRATGTWRISYSGGGSLTKAFGWSSTIPVAADYDGDGKTDLAVYHPATGNWHILKSTTGGTVVKNWGWSATKPTLLYPLIHTWFNLP